MPAPGRKLRAAVPWRATYGQGYRFSRDRPAGAQIPAGFRPHPALPRVHAADVGKGSRETGRALHGLRHSLLPWADRLSGSQPDPGLERPRLQWRLGHGDPQPALDQQFSRVDRAHLPGTVRGGVHAQSRGHSSRHQDDRARDRRQGLGDGLYAALSGRAEDRQEGRHHRFGTGRHGGGPATWPGGSRRARL
jgi:hypothetical protein